MSSERLTSALFALGLTACVGSQGPKPPSFPSGGLLALSTLPPNPWSLQNALEGVYDTTRLFGDTVVVHASQWGEVGSGLQASVSILAGDHFAYALMQPGCLTDTTTSPSTQSLVLEGYWRYLDDPNPSPSTTGLIRLFVSPQSVVDYVCGAPAWIANAPPGDPRPPPADTATLTGSTGAGQNEPGDPLTVSYVRPRKNRLGDGGEPTFFVGVHHGGCQTLDNCGISENTPETSILATQLGGDYLEVDTHLTADGVPVVFHLGLNPAVTQGIYCTGQVEDYTYDQLLANCRLRNGEIIPRAADLFSYVLRRTNLPLYLDSKSESVIAPVSQILASLQDSLVPCNPPPPDAGSPWPPAGKSCLFPGSAPVWQRGVIGLPDSSSVAAYQQALDAGQLAPNQHCLVETDPSAVTSVPCVAWMPRYTLGPMTSTVQPLQQQGFFVGFWTINDPATIDAFLTQASPNGILTNYLGLLNQRFEVVGTPPPNTPFMVTTP
jgi:glycerophosphoryl diester phosphodiesterase